MQETVQAIHMYFLVKTFICQMVLRSIMVTMLLKQVQVHLQVQVPEMQTLQITH